MEAKGDPVHGKHLAAVHPILIGGAFVPGEGEPLPVVDPSNGTRFGTVGTASAAQVAVAAEAGKAGLAGSGWAGWEPHRRALVFYGIAGTIEERIDRIAELQVRENGKTRKESVVQAKSAAATFRYYAGVCETLHEDMPPARGNYVTMTVHEPFGVVAALTPWNSPLTMGAQKIAPALAAGNAVILKPAETTSLVSLALGECCVDGGLPAGLISILPGRGDLGAALVADPGIGCISFTGGTATGLRIASVASERLVPLILELGGKSPHIVFADADLSNAARSVATGIFESTGQSCVAGSRLLVERAIADEFLNLMVDEAKTFVVGPPTDPGTVIGPLSSFAHRERVEGFVDAAVAEGARVVVGGTRPEGARYDDGAYYLPTILAGLGNESATAQEEIFGPVLCALTFEDEDDLVTQANDSVYGLASGIWTADYKRAWRVARRLQAGSVWINTYKQLSIAAPFGGFKMSGLGREKGIQGLRAYQESKSIYWGL